MGRNTIVIAWLLLVAAAPAAAAEFTEKPSATRDGDRVLVTFAVDAATDVAVEVVDAGGRVVRHLAAGLLGERAPAPLAAGSLRQALAWDGTNDAGEKAEGGPFRVRVRLGVGAEFDRIIGWDPHNIDAPRALACGDDGTLYVVHGEKFQSHRRTTLITAYGPDGTYRRQVFPGPGGLPAGQRAGWAHVTPEGGREVPVVHHVLTRSTYPGAYFGTGEHGYPAVTGDGRLVIVSGSATTVGALIKYADVREGRRLLILGADGSVPANFLGPVLAGPKVGGVGHVAVSPDAKFAYVCGLGSHNLWGKQVAKEMLHVVQRVSLGEPGKVEDFIGKRGQAGGGKDLLRDPRGVAVDADGNLLVADRGNRRIAVFDPSGTYLAEFAAEGVSRIALSRRTGAVYAETDGGVVKFAAPRPRDWGAYRPAATAPWPDVNGKKLQDRCWTLDDSGDRPALYLSGTWWVHHALLKYADAGDRFAPLGDPIAAHADPKSPGLPFVMNVGVAGRKLITRTPGPILANVESMSYDALTGDYLGFYVPKQSAGGDKESRQAVMFCGGEMTVGQDGRVYSQSGGFMWPAKNQANPGTVRRYDAEGNPVAFAASGRHFIHKLYHGHNRPAGMWVRADGTIYVAAFPGYRGRDQAQPGLNIYVIDPYGNLQEKTPVRVVGATVGGVAMGPDGSFYLGLQVWPKDQRMPPRFAGKLPADSEWGHPAKAYRQHGMIVKFRPEGGGVALDENGRFMGHAGGYAGRDAWRRQGVSVRLDGALWHRRLGYVSINDPDEAGCQCENTRFDVDGHGRLFVPDLFSFRVAVLDSAGNPLADFGAFGNMDNRGPDSARPTPAIPFGWPIAVELAHGRVYVADLINRRIVVAKLTADAEATCDVK